MGGQKKVLLIANSADIFAEILGKPPENVDLVKLPDPKPGLPEMIDERYEQVDACFIDGKHVKTVFDINRYLHFQDIIEAFPAGFVIVDADKRIIRSNGLFSTWAGLEHADDAIGRQFYEILGMPEIFDQNPCPFHLSRQKRQRTKAKLTHRERQQFFQMDVVPIIDAHGAVSRFFVFLSDIAQLVAFDQKLRSIQMAGRDLANLSASDLLDMSTEQRLAMLAQKIALYTDNLLNFGNFEIRLLSHTEPGLLEPLVYSGMNQEAVERRLYRSVTGNGITGYVAFTGERYLMDDADNDPLYLPGAQGAKSSMTVPLISQGDVIGTFNVESQERGAFTKTDLELLETFARDVAHAINMMELISVEHMDTAFKSIEAIHGAVAGPINAIQLEAAKILTVHNDLDREVVEQIRSIQRKALDIQDVIHKVGNRLVPAHAHPMPPDNTPHPLLKGRRVFVVDPDESVGLMVNSLLQRYGCIVEMAPDGGQALLRARVNPFDVIISDIKLPDMNGYELLQALRDIMRIPFIPLILMKGYGYDPAHVLTKSKQDGVIGFLSKPFILDQVLTNIELVINESIEKNGDDLRQHGPGGWRRT